MQKATKRKYTRRAPVTKLRQRNPRTPQPQGPVSHNLTTSAVDSDPVPQVQSSVEKINRVDIAKAIKLILVQGMPQADVARSMGVSDQAVNQALKPLKALLNNPLPTQVYNDRKEEILDAAMSKMLVHSLEPERLKKMSTYQLIGSFGILFDKQRLVRGESTSNFDIRSQSVYLGREIDKLRQELGESETVIQGKSELTD